MKIENLNFSVRTYNILKRARIDTLEQLRQLSEVELMRVRNLGKHSLEEIHEKLESYTMTNADRIRSMTNEQLRNFLDKFRVETFTEPFGEKFCKNCPTTEGTVEGGLIPLRLSECDFEDGVCPHGDALLWWLSQTEVKHEPD